MCHGSHVVTLCYDLPGLYDMAQLCMHADQCMPISANCVVCRSLLAKVCGVLHHSCSISVDLTLQYTVCVRISCKSNTCLARKGTQGLRLVRTNSLLSIERIILLGAQASPHVCRAIREPDERHDASSLALQLTDNRYGAALCSLGVVSTQQH